jgi:hypothetical protein
VSGSGEETLPLQPKSIIAGQLIERIEAMLSSRTPVLR